MKAGYDVVIHNEDGLYCFRCNVALVSDKVFFKYLISTFPAQMLKCPICSQVYIDEKTVMTKAAEVEMVLEEK